MPIKIDCYMAIVKKYRKIHPDAHFEFVTRSRSNSVLAPSVNLLIDAGVYKKSDGTKNPKMKWDEYKKRFRQEILENDNAMKRLKELKKMSDNKIVYLVCFEKDPSKCHRSILKEIIEEIE